MAKTVVVQEATIRFVVDTPPCYCASAAGLNWGIQLDGKSGEARLYVSCRRCGTVVFVPREKITASIGFKPSCLDGSQENPPDKG